MRTRLITAAFMVLLASTSAQAQARPVATQQAAASADVAGASEAGATAGGSKSTASAALVSGTTSLMLPGAGFIYLLFLKSGEVQPNFAEQAFLRDKSPEYTKVWVASYDRALTAKQKRTIIIATTVGSVASYFLVYKPLLDRPTY